MPEGWRWDETLYLGSAPYYARGRPPYAPDLAPALARALSLDGHGRLVDVGCGPGIVTLLLAPLVAQAIGVDADAAMLAEAERRAAAAGIANARWLRARAEFLPFGPGTVRLATFAQSFHWMDRPRVAAAVLVLLEPGGAFVPIRDVKEPRPVPPPADPPPPYAAIRDLIRSYLGPVRRAGQGSLPHGTPGDEATILSRAGFTGPQRLLLPAAGPLLRTADDLVAWVWSHSGSAPHLFADRRAAFETDLRRLLHDASPTDRFADHPSDTEVFIWRTTRP